MMQEQLPKPTQTNGSHVVWRLASVIVAGLLIVGTTYAVQYRRVQAAQHKTEQLNGKVATLKTKLAALQAQTNISTAGWKTYCDPADKYCFKYPSDWKIDQSSQKYNFGATISGATVTNPKGTLQVKYTNYDVRDAGPISTHIASVDSLDNTTVTAKIVGEYFVSSVNCQPFFVAAGADDIKGLAPGKVALWANNVRFISDNQLIASRIGNDLTTPDQAEAWFSSVDAKTALAIMRSLHKD